MIRIRDTRIYLRLLVLFVASAKTLAGSNLWPGMDLPCIPTLPPSLSHWMSISRLSLASLSLDSVASALLWLK